MYHATETTLAGAFAGERVTVLGTLARDASHDALVRYASSGAEALLAFEPQALRDLIAARKSEDWAKVAALIDWLEAGLQSSEWH